jgi:3,4-dihydroxy 2-butanone 4-phosphate synthase/GTP cyclohydrolase II
VDLAMMAGLYPAGLVCEIIKDDGTMARMPDLEELSRKHNLRILTVAQIIAYRQHHEKLVEKVAEASLPTASGTFSATAFRSTLDNVEHLAMVMGHWEPEDPVLVRIHSECLTGDVFGSQRCDCGEQINIALAKIASEGRGVFLYLRQEGRGIGLVNKIKAYSLQDNGLDTVEANESLGFDFDERNYSTGAQMLVELGVRKLRLLTNNPRKMVGLGGYGLEIASRVPIGVKSNEVNKDYIEAKHDRMGHFSASD